MNQQVRRAIPKRSEDPPFLRYRVLPEGGESFGGLRKILVFQRFPAMERRARTLNSKRQKVGHHDWLWLLGSPEELQSVDVVYGGPKDKELTKGNLPGPFESGDRNLGNARLFREFPAGKMQGTTAGLDVLGGQLLRISGGVETKEARKNLAVIRSHNIEKGKITDKLDHTVLEDACVLRIEVESQVRLRREEKRQVEAGGK